MSLIEASPPARRIAVAFLVATMVPSLALACGGPFEGSASEMLVGFLIRSIYGLIAAALMTVALGLPAFLLLRRSMRFTAFRCASVGALLAAMPWLPIKAATFGFPWTFVGILAALGALGGLTFWAIAAGPTSRGPLRGA